MGFNKTSPFLVIQETIFQRDNNQFMSCIKYPSWWWVQAGLHKSTAIGQPYSAFSPWWRHVMDTFSAFWTFVRGIHQWLFFYTNLKKLLKKQSSGQKFETPWRSCDVTVTRKFWKIIKTILWWDVHKHFLLRCHPYINCSWNVMNVVGINIDTWCTKYQIITRLVSFWIGEVKVSLP